MNRRGFLAWCGLTPLAALLTRRTTGNEARLSFGGPIPKSLKMVDVGDSGEFGIHRKFTVAHIARWYNVPPQLLHPLTTPTPSILPEGYRPRAKDWSDST